MFNSIQYSKLWVKTSAFVAASFLLCSAVQAKDHVLVMTISNYAGKPLAGVVHDAQTALKIAQRMGYNTSSAMIYKDSQLTRQGMVAALDQLVASVAANDRVFVYYSGHGYSGLQGNQCVQSLVTQDEGLIGLENGLSDKLQKIKNLVSDTFVLIDACHSGGLRDVATLRSSAAKGGSDAEVTGKAWQAKAGEQCSNFVNFAKSWTPVTGERTRGAIFPKDNFVFMAAANEREVALDDPQRGGLASTSILSCLESGVVDKDQSGSISPTELAACAQTKVIEGVRAINAAKGSKFTAHTIEVNGNVDRPLLTVPAVPVVSASTPSANAASASVAVSVEQQLQQILKGSNGRLSLSVNPTALSVNVALPSSQREVRFPYTSNQKGYGYILYVGTDGVDMGQIFPDKQYGDNNAMAVSGEFMKLQIKGPPGKNTILFVLSQTPMDFSNVFPAAGAAVTPENLLAVQCELDDRNVARADGKVACGAKRNVARTDNRPAMGAIEGYAAQLITIEGK